jgi:hypothetical protein
VFPRYKAHRTTACNLTLAAGAYVCSWTKKPILEEVLRDTDHSYTIEELALLAYPKLFLECEHKHRVSVLRALDNVEKRLSLWRFQTYDAP